MEISASLQTTIDNAFNYAQEKKHEFLTCEHLLMQFLNDTDVQNMLSSFNINISLLEILVVNFLLICHCLFNKEPILSKDLLLLLITSMPSELIS